MKESIFVDRYCIIRCRDAGVHAGTVMTHDGNSVVLSNSRRLWRWCSRFTLTSVAMLGIIPDKSKIEMNIPLIGLEGACEIIPCTDVSMDSIVSAKEHNKET